MAFRRGKNGAHAYTRAIINYPSTEVNVAKEFYEYEMYADTCLRGNKKGSIFSLVVYVWRNYKSTPDILFCLRMNWIKKGLPDRLWVCAKFD